MPVAALRLWSWRVCVAVVLWGAAKGVMNFRHAEQAFPWADRPALVQYHDVFKFTRARSYAVYTLNRIPSIRVGQHCGLLYTKWFSALS